MKFLLGLWQPKNKFCKFLKGIVKVMAICLLLGFLILPFICFDEAVQDIIKWIWLSCAVCNIDNLWDYKKFHKEKLITPLFSLFAILTLTYLYNYWNYLSLTIVICVSIVIGLLEFIVSIAVYKTIRLTEKMDGKQLPKGVIHGLVLGGLYICALILFILGHFINQNMIFIFGGISLIMLSISVLICIGNGISFKKNIVSTVSFIIDVICLLALIVYLIYLIPNDENLQDIVLAIIASVVGGALALAGVAWTIKDGNKQRQEELQRVENERKEEERKKYRPFVNVYAGHNLQGLPSTEPIRVTDWLKNTDKISNVQTENLNIANNIRDCCFANSDFSNFYVWGIKIDDSTTDFKSYRYIRKERYFQLSFTGPIYTEKPIETLSLILEDMLGNFYELKLDFGFNSIYQQIVISGNGHTVFIGEKKTENIDE